MFHIGKPKKKVEDNAPYCVLTMPLYPELWPIDIIETRFRIMEHIENSLIALELRKLRNFDGDDQTRKG